MPKIKSWSIEDFKKNLKQRLDHAQKFCDPFFAQQQSNANMFYNDLGRGQDNSSVNITFDNRLELESGEVDSSSHDTGTNYVFRSINFRHGILTANPPIATASPHSPDLDDRRSAESADYAIRHGYEHYKVSEKFSDLVRTAMVRGGGWIANKFNPNGGELESFDPATNEVKMQGDHEIYCPANDRILIDPLAKDMDDVRYIFERHSKTLEEVEYMFPEQFNKIKEMLAEAKNTDLHNLTGEDIIDIWEYTEKGLPINGMVGRHCWLLESGEVLGKPTKNKNFNAQLPYFYLGDVKIDDLPFCKSRIEYVSHLQDLLSRMDQAFVEGVEAHAVYRLMVPETTEITDDNFGNSSFDVMFYGGAQPPHFLNPPSMPQDVIRLRQQYKEEISEIIGLNDAMMGVQKREQSGFSQQTAIEAGNNSSRDFMERIRQVVKDFWVHYLGNAKINWTTARTLKVMGKENVLNVRSIKGTDFASGCDISADQGQSLPIDPNQRREQIMLLMEPLKEAGMPMTTILKKLKLNELDSLYDELSQGEDRQQEIFDQMVEMDKNGEPAYIAPEKLENHETYLLFCQKFRNSMAYKILPESSQVLIEKHINDRMDMAKEIMAEQQPAEQPQQPGANPLASLV